MKHKILLSDLAAAAQCSISQASRALNGKVNVAPEIRNRVLQAAQNLNYRNLANRHVPVIGIVKNDIICFFLTEIIWALEIELRRRNWKWQIIDVCNAGAIKEFFYDGLIAVVSDFESIQFCTQQTNLPLVAINNYGSAMETLCSIDPDSAEESRLVLEHLAGLGHRQIARIKQIAPNSDRQLSHRGDEEFMSEAQLLGLGNTVRTFLFNDPSELETLVRTILAEKFTAIFMIHQHLAVLISSVLHQLGIRIPEDISLVTYEVPYVTGYLYPPHTTLDFNYPEMARISVEQLQKRMRGESVPVTIKAPVQFHLRASTARSGLS